MKLVTRNYNISVNLFWPRKNIEVDALKLKTSLHYRYSVHDKGGNTSNLLLDLEMHHPTLNGFVKSE